MNYDILFERLNVVPFNMLAALMHSPGDFDFADCVRCRRLIAQSVFVNICAQDLGSTYAAQYLAGAMRWTRARLKIFARLPPWTRARPKTLAMAARWARVAISLFLALVFCLPPAAVLTPVARCPALVGRACARAMHVVRTC